MFRSYNVNEYDLEKDIEVFINGEKTPLRKCFVSKYPLNCRWPGHQRETSQRIENWFTSFESDEKLTVKVIYNKDVKSVLLKPRERVETPVVSGREITFTLHINGGYTLSINGYQNTIHFFNNKLKAFDIDREDENVLYFGSGIHDVGLLNLNSNQTVYIEEDAVVYGVIHASNAENIKILGKGTLDVSKTRETILKEMQNDYRDYDKNNAKREHTLQFINCKNIEIDGITVKDSLLYNVTTWNCEDVKINGINVIGCWRFNTDGIDLHNTRNAYIKDCFLRTFDDCLCVKGHLPYATDCYNITFDNCVVWNDWGNALHVGVEGCADNMKDITYKNCYVLRATGTVLNVSTVDYADVGNVVYDNISVEFDEDRLPGVLQTEDNQAYNVVTEKDRTYQYTFAVRIFHHHEYSEAREKGYGKIHDVTFNNIRIYSPSRVVSVVEGQEESKIKNVTFKDIYINGEKTMDINDIHFEPIDNSENIVIR